MTSTKPRHLDDGTKCPLWQKACAKVCHDCMWWNLVRGKHPQTGAEVDQWSCAIALMPMLMIENAMVGRQTTATVDKLCQEVHEAKDASMVSTISNLNARMDAALVAPASAQKLIG